MEEKLHRGYYTPCGYLPPLLFGRVPHPFVIESCKARWSTNGQRFSLRMKMQALYRSAGWTHFSRCHSGLNDGYPPLAHFCGRCAGSVSHRDSARPRSGEGAMARGVLSPSPCEACRCIAFARRRDADLQAGPRGNVPLETAGLRIVITRRGLQFPATITPARSGVGILSPPQCPIDLMVRALRRGRETRHRVVLSWTGRQERGHLRLDFEGIATCSQRHR